jgi:hypothetical protein
MHLLIIIKLTFKWKLLLLKNNFAQMYKQKFWIFGFYFKCEKSSFLRETNVIKSENVSLKKNQY